MVCLSAGLQLLALCCWAQAQQHKDALCIQTSVLCLPSSFIFYGKCCIMWCKGSTVLQWLSLELNVWSPSSWWQSRRRCCKGMPHVGTGEKCQ